MGDLYDRIQSVDVTGRAPRLKGGNYLLAVTAIKEHTSKGKGGRFFIPEFVVEVSDNPEIQKGFKTGDPINLQGKYPDSALGQVKAFASALLGYNPSDKEVVDRQITPEVIRGLLVNGGAHFAGALVACNVWLKTQANNPSAAPFANYSYAPCLENGQVKRIVVAQAQAPSHFAGSLPPVPGMQAPPALPQMAPSWPPAGWIAHPQAPGYFYKGQEVLAEADLRARAAQGGA